MAKKSVASRMADLVYASQAEKRRSEQGMREAEKRRITKERAAGYDAGVAEYPAIRMEIRRRARQGLDHWTKNLFQWSRYDTLTPHQEGYCDAIEELAVADDFHFEVQYHTMEPFGNDPLFDHTVYDANLIISWGKGLRE